LVEDNRWSLLQTKSPPQSFSTKTENAVIAETLENFQHSTLLLRKAEVTQGDSELQYELNEIVGEIVWSRKFK
jgi:hypothetical protein